VKKCYFNKTRRSKTAQLPAWMPAVLLTCVPGSFRGPVRSSRYVGDARPLPRLLIGAGEMAPLRNGMDEEWGQQLAWVGGTGRTEDRAMRAACAPYNRQPMTEAHVPPPCCSCLLACSSAHGI
jgi:hypothetical protein